MPWAAIPFEDQDRKKALGQRLGVRAIPTLVTVSPDGEVINQTARGAASADAKARHLLSNRLPRTSLCRLDLYLFVSSSVVPFCVV